ncbi:MAG: ArsR/SmtB family transcription factor [Chloroflexota bacterium]
MAPFTLKLEKTADPNGIAVSVEPASNGFMSLLLAAKHDQDPGIHEWINRFHAAISSEEFMRHKLVMLGFFYAVVPEKHHDTFTDYIDHLESQPPSALRERLLNSYASIFNPESAPIDCTATVNWDEVLSSTENYLAFLRSRFGEENIDVELETRAYEYVLDPAALKQLIVSHLRWVWKNHLEPEWQRVQPMLAESARAFQKVDLGSMSRIEAARFVTGQELDESQWAKSFEKSEELLFIPNAHIGPYLQRAHSGNGLIVYFGARQPESAEERIPALERAEIVARLSALADDTRLNILQMIAERGEMRAPEVIDATGLSQPSVSRYLIQLTAAGFLQERRVNGAKIYSLNRDRIEKTLKAVSAFLLGRSHTSLG